MYLCICCDPDNILYLHWQDMGNGKKIRPKIIVGTNAFELCLPPWREEARYMARFMAGVCWPQMCFSGRINICPYTYLVHRNYDTPLSRAPARVNFLSLIVDATLSHIRSVLYDAAEFVLCQAR